MSWSRPELVALVVLLGWSLAAAGGSGSGGISGAGASVGAGEVQLNNVKLSALRVHRQLLQAEIARLYMDTFSPETPLLLEELQQRQHEVQLQIETLEGNMARDQDAHNLALDLAADFAYLQHKLDDLKQQLQQLNAMQSNNSIGSSNKHPTEEAQRDAVNTTPSAPTTGSAIGSYFWTPLLTMPELPSGSIAQSTQGSPSLIKRLLAMLRPNSSASSSSSTSSSGSSFSQATSFLRGQRPDPSKAKDTKVQLLSPAELLPQLQLQREFLDDAIKRLEHLTANNNNNNGDNKV